MNNSDKLNQNEKAESINNLNFCVSKCVSTSYCEYCARSYLKSNFSKWSSGNTDINDSIQHLQIESCAPHKIFEWIPYDNLQNIQNEVCEKYWIDGPYVKWDSEEQQLKRLGTHKVIMKRIENVECTNRSWFKKVCICINFKTFYLLVCKLINI